MLNGGDWEDDVALQNYLAVQLEAGRVALFIGAGVSFASGLPGWSELLAGMYRRCGADLDDASDSVKAASVLLHKHLGGDREQLAKLTQEALYEGFSRWDMRDESLLRSLSALVMASSRRTQGRVVSYNFDDLLEAYLVYYGHVVEQVTALPKFRSQADVTVLHPHGLLPSNHDEPRGKIVLTLDEYDDVLGSESQVWLEAVTEVMRTSMCLFIGLSGDDSNLRACMKKVQQSHAVGGNSPYWGVAFVSSGDVATAAAVWRARRVFPKALEDWGELPSWLSAICRRAADVQMKSLGLESSVDAAS